MADSSYEKGLSELSKMKVADLKAELKQRGLPTTGNKTELVERLQLAIHDASLSLDETTDEILDEDAVLGDEEIEELSTKPDSQDVGEKRKSTEDSSPIQAKKIILNRNPVIEEVKVDEPEEKEEKSEGADDSGPAKKVIKLSELGVKERLEMRAKKFGVPLSDTAKKEVRSARFNSENQSNGKSSASIKTPVNTSYEVLKKRAERFGTNASGLMEKAELEARIEKRKARFGEVKPIEKTFPNRVKIVK
ncbi:SAP domain-containing ribonucleoprotein isoform X2 [Diachasma alloeum]|uniref:SAP domain-containing ribonucleoprotein isoform X2 n=1 Tax=Diachasma alloeum TaxID=454923 RepID=UPI0007381FFE|nr:SAP domain-containing ribonucleoprotein isoform X2 [Diachasma alloeum]